MDQQNPDVLMEEDYEVLLKLLMEKDPRGGELIKTLSPDEQQAFFDYQAKTTGKSPGKQMPGGTIAGMPAELAAIGGALGAGKAMLPKIPEMGSEVLKTGAGLAAGAAGGAIGRAMGVPPWITDMLIGAAGKYAGKKSGSPAAKGGNDTASQVSKLGLDPSKVKSVTPGANGVSASTGKTVRPAGTKLRDVSTPLSGPKAAASEMSGKPPRRGLSEGEEAGIDSLNKLQEAMGSPTSVGNGTFQPSNLSVGKTPMRGGSTYGRSVHGGVKLRDPQGKLSEIPPGATRKTPHSEFKDLANREAQEAYDDPAEIERIMDTLKVLLDKGKKK